MRWRPSGIELDDDRPSESAAGGEVARSCRPSAPTSTARSTWSRRWRAASASTASAAPSPTRTARSACSRSASRSVGWSPTRSWASGSPRRSRSRWSSPADLERAGRAARPGRARHQPAARRGVGAAHRGAARPAAGGRRQPRPRGSPTSRCSRWAASSSPPSTGDDPATTRCPTSPSTSPWRGPAASAVGRWRTTGRSTCTTRSTRSQVALDALGIDDVVLEAGVAHRLPRRARRAGARRRRRRGHRGRGRARRCSTRSGSRAPVVAAELVLDTLLDAARRDRTFRAPSRFPASTIDLAFVVADGVAAAAVVRHARAPRSATCSRTCACSTCSPATRSAPGRRSLAFALRFRGPDRTLTDADVGRVASAGHRRGRAPPTAPSCAGDAGSSTTSGRATPRSTSRAWCSTPTGSPTSTKRRPGSSSASGSRRRDAFFREFDVMVVKAVLEWEGPAGFDDDVAIARRPRPGRHEVVRPRVHRDERGRARVRRDDHLRVGAPRDPRLGGDPRRAPRTRCSSVSRDLIRAARARLRRRDRVRASVRRPRSTSRTRSPKSERRDHRVEPVVVGGQHDGGQREHRVCEHQRSASGSDPRGDDHRPRDHDRPTEVERRHGRELVGEPLVRAPRAVRRRARRRLAVSTKPSSREHAGRRQREQQVHDIPRSVITTITLRKRR